KAKGEGRKAKTNKGPARRISVLPVFALRLSPFAFRLHAPHPLIPAGDGFEEQLGGGGGLAVQPFEAVAQGGGELRGEARTRRGREGSPAIQKLPHGEIFGAGETRDVEGRRLGGDGRGLRQDELLGRHGGALADDERARGEVAEPLVVPAEEDRK